MFISNVLSSVKTLLNPLDAEMLLSFVLCLPREYLIAHQEHRISQKQASQFQKYCEARAGGIPLAYLTHHKEFYGLDFYVDERVFIPRPETELLVEAVLSQYLNFPISQYPNILDLGTGSGCIAISLAKNLPHARIVASDISEDALAVARKNAEFHGVSSRIKFIKSNLLSKFLNTQYSLLNTQLIVANLPYIGTSENHLVSREVFEHEPHSALFSGKNGLELYERLFAQIHTLRQSFDKLRMTKGDKAPKWLIGEIGFLQQEAIEKLIRKYFGTISVQFKNDLSGLPRLFSISF